MSKKKNKDLIDKIFYTTWGYDQTQAEFLKVIGLSGTGKSAYCKMIRQERVKGAKTARTSNKVKPNGAVYGDKFRLGIKEGYKGERILRGSYPFLKDGKMDSGKRLDTFLQYNKEDKGILVTAPGFGH